MSNSAPLDIRPAWLKDAMACPTCSPKKKTPPHKNVELLRADDPDAAPPSQGGGIRLERASGI